MNKNNKKVLAFIVFLAISLLSFDAYAVEQTDKPAEPINIKNALREKPIDETVGMVNMKSTNLVIEFSAEGDIADWIKFYRKASDTNNITEIEIPAESDVDIIARFIVPVGTPNGSYKGYISASPKTTAVESSADSSVQKVDREVTIEVKDVENIVFDTSLVPEKYDMNQGDFLRIRVIHNNQGNIEISPKISLKIKQDENIFYNAIFPYPDSQPKIAPYSLLEIPQLEIPTSELSSGKYEAVLTISQGDKYSIDKNFTFSVGTVKAASATSAPSQKNPLGISRVTIIMITGLALYAVLRSKKRYKKKSSL